MALGALNLLDNGLLDVDMQMFVLSTYWFWFTATPRRNSLQRGFVSSPPSLLGSEDRLT